jgi:hypothetical protein
MGDYGFNVRYVTNMMGKAEMANYCFLTNSHRSWCKSGGELQNSLCRFPWQVQPDPEGSKKASPPVRWFNDIDSWTSAH